MKRPLTAFSFHSLCAGVGRDRVSEQRSSCPRPSGRPALLLHHQCCPQQSQHHLDGDPAVQRQPTRAGTAKNTPPTLKKKTPTNPDLRIMQKSVYFQVFFCSLRDGSIRWAVPVPVPHGSVSGSDFALSHTALPPLVVWFHLSWLTCSCRPHKLTCLPSLWTPHWSAVQIIQSASALITLCPQQAQYHSCSHYTDMHAHV